ncbi:MAG TPA: CD225/dispanin family protein [Actinomycetales bacterium]|nr:CD225/dispanin family protein [Actinomycetales bacterium]
MSQYPGQPDDPQRSSNGDQDPYASPSPQTHGGQPPQFSKPEPYGQPPAYGQPAPYGQPTPYGQAPVYGQQPVGTPPQNYLVWAILSTLFCCLPLGVVSIVFAAQVNSKWSAGDVAGAQDAAEKAKKFAMWSAIAAVAVIVLYVLLIVVIGVGRGLTSP